MKTVFFCYSKVKISTLGLLLCLLILLIASAPRVASADGAKNAAGSPVTKAGEVKAAVPAAAAGMPGISISPSSYDFGNVNVGETQRATFVISSTGKADLIISAIDIAAPERLFLGPLPKDMALALLESDCKEMGITGCREAGLAFIRILDATSKFDPSAFEIDSGTCQGISPTIKGGTSCTIAVAYSPTYPGKGSARIEVSSNSQTSPLFSIPVAGAGVPAVPAAQQAVPVSQPALPQVKPVVSQPKAAVPAAQQEKPITVTLTSDKTSPALSSAAEKVTFVSHASGGSGTFEYKFWLKGPLTGNVWTVAQEYSTASAFSWTPSLAGDYTIWVYVRNAGNGMADAGSAWMPFDVVDNPPVSSVEITADKTSPVLRSEAGTVTFTPHAQGGSGSYEYKFWLKGPSTGNVWTVVHEYGGAATFSWVPAQAGSYAVWVAARNAGSPAASEASSWMSFDVVDNPPVKSVALTPDKPSPEAKTTVGGVTFRAKASGPGSSYEYKFWLKGPTTANTWTVARAYDKSNTFSWQPSQPGTYEVSVYARNAGSPAGHEAVAGVSFEIIDK
jgi:hypothetical protein